MCEPVPATLGFSHAENESDSKGTGTGTGRESRGILLSVNFTLYSVPGDRCIMDFQSLNEPLTGVA